jgi:lipid A 4'-phosphatase
VRGLAIYAGLLVVALALFLLLPQIDLLASGLFYARGRGFVLANWPPVILVYRAIPWVTWGIVLAVVGAAAWLFLVNRPLWRFDRKALLFIALSTALGPGLLANTLLKDHWGRARPVQIEAFGGSLHFTPAPLPATECARNCSFVSGHAALAFSLVAFAFLLASGPQRRRGIGAALAFGGIVGLVRIAQGGHFLSDVVFAGLLVFGTTALLYWWIVEVDGLAAPPLRRLYRVIGRGSALTWRFARESWPSPAVRVGLAVAVTTILVLVTIEIVDRPLALFLHARDPDLHALFGQIGRLGEAWGWLILFALAFAGLHWGGELPRLRPAAEPMRALSAVPAFLFASIAVSGLAADILKVVLGRLRPKLLFSADLYGFTWLGWRADHWSFPSGHTATIVALISALWWLWPRHLLFYILAAAIVAGSRIVVGAHYPSDVMGGALVAVLTTWYVALLFARWGIDLAAVRQGRIGSGEALPWPCRCFGQMRAVRRQRARDRVGHSLASTATGVVSPRDHGAADRDL